MNDENPSIPPLLSGNEVLSPVIDMGESKDKGGRGIRRARFIANRSIKSSQTRRCLSLSLSLVRPVIDDILLFAKLRLFVYASSFSIMPSILVGSWLNYDGDVNYDESIRSIN